MIEADAALPFGTTGSNADAPTTAETTGRFVVVFAEDSDPADLLQSVAGVATIADSRDFDDGAVDLADTSGADATLLSELNIAVVSADPTQIGALQIAEDGRGAVIAVEPELVHHILDGDTLAGGLTDYLRGYRDGVGDLSARLLGDTGSAGFGAAAGSATFQDTDQFTWGLQATLVSTSAQSGDGVRVAVLDTGFDSTHPDFAGRNITTSSFVPGETSQDGHGHGTHCIGTACGPKAPPGATRRYGCAHEAEIFVGKVLSDGGSGVDAGILAGINWALVNGCQVISMSLGADQRTVHMGYEIAGRRCLRRGTLIVAAAGNNARRPGDPGFVGVPANSPSVMAVAAVDAQLKTAPFSAQSNPVKGGHIDLAGPGVAVYSSWRTNQRRYHTISGTSMATPHVAGIAALWCEKTERRGRELWSTLTQEGRRLNEPSVDVGCGLAQAPQ